MTQKKILLPLRPCEQCWETFQPTNANNRKYCSEKCSKANRLEKSRATAKQTMIDGSGNNRYLKLRFEVFRRDNFTCQYCGRVVKDGIKLHIDHIIPKSKGGDLSMDNLITSCFDCNEGKRDVILTEREIAKLRGDK